jgi:hypothetical protein
MVVSLRPGFEAVDVAVGNDPMLGRQAVNERASRRQVECNGIGAEEDTQAPFAPEIPPHITGQRAQKECNGRYDQADDPVPGEGENGEDGHQRRDDREHDHAEERKQSPKNRRTILDRQVGASSGRGHRSPRSGEPTRRRIRR